MSLFSDSINFEQKSISTPNYAMQKILQQSGGSNVSWSANSTLQTYFDLPIAVYNLSKSMLTGEIVIPAQGAGNFSAYLHNNHPIVRASIQTRSGKFLADIQNFQHYWKLSCASGIKNEEWCQRPTPSCDITIANSRTNSLSLGLNPSNAADTQTAAAANTFCGISITAAGGVVNTLTFKRKNTNVCNFVTSAANDVLSIKWQLNFGDMIGTFFSVDKDFYSTESLQLVIEIANYNKIALLHTVVSDFTGANTLPVAPQFTSYALYLAVEQNESVVQAIKNQVLSSGLKMTIPYSNVFRQSLGTATSGSVQQRINRAHGKNLLRILSAEGVTGDSLQLSANYYNFAGVQTVQFYTTIDSRQQEPETLNVQNGDDFRYMSRMISNTLLNNPQEYYALCPVYVNDFSGCVDLPSCKQGDLIERGRPLDQEVLFGKVITQKSAIDSTCTIVAVCQKDLVSTAQGVDVM